MKRINIEARIKSNKLDELAGGFYQDANSQITKDLRKKNKAALLGIKREDGVYTIIGEEYTYYSTSSGVVGEISHEDFLKILKDNAFNLGKSGEFHFVNINGSDSIWVLNGPTMNAIWNTIILLHDNRVGRM
jgi:hypothetical protein